MAANSAGAGNSKTNPAEAGIGIIGGSGLYTMSGLTGTREVHVKTPFGEPSDAIAVGTLEGKRVAFLARHGRGHRILPSEINYRANVYAMKLLGFEEIISVSAVGSLKEDLRPAFALIGVTRADFNNVKAQHATGVPALVLKDVTDFESWHSHGIPDTQIDNTKEKSL